MSINYSDMSREVELPVSKGSFFSDDQTSSWNTTKIFWVSLLTSIVLIPLGLGLSFGLIGNAGVDNDQPVEHPGYHVFPHKAIFGVQMLFWLVPWTVLSFGILTVYTISLVHRFAVQAGLNRAALINSSSTTSLSTSSTSSSASSSNEVDISGNAYSTPRRSSTAFTALPHPTQSFTYFIASLITLILLTIFTFIAFSYSFRMMNFGAMYDADYWSVPLKDPFLQLWGVIIFFIAFPWTLVLLAQIYKSVNMYYYPAKHQVVANASVSHFFSTVKQSTSYLARAFWKHNVSALVVVILFLVAMFMAAISIYPHWAKVFVYPLGFPQLYFQAASEWNLLPASLANVSSKFSFKLYTDVLVYYVVLFSIAIIGFISHVYSPLRRVLKTRITWIGGKKSLISSWGYLFEYGATVGELLFLAAIIGLFIFWGFWWTYFITARQQHQRTPKDDFGLQIAARVLGHLATLAMSLTLFPVARNSLLERLFGVPFDHQVKFHRALGFLAYMITTIHLLVWWVKWIGDGVLGRNLTWVNGVAVGPEPEPHWHFDNFTVFASHISWLFLTGFIIIALLMRRRQYELFYYTHHFAIGVILTAFVHAWSFWYFATPPVLLWVFDRMFRLQKFTRTTAVVACGSSCGDITRITIPAASLKHIAPGQYAWINIPSVSAVQWHPFTISSPPSASFRTFHIKDMGANTFTHGVAMLPLKASSSDSGALSCETDILVDGPYGRHPPFSQDTHTLILVAGGVGVTPVMSIYAELYARIRAANRARSRSTSGASHNPSIASSPDDDALSDVSLDMGFHSNSSSSLSNPLLDPSASPAVSASIDNLPLGSIKKVILIWVVRQPHQLAAFADTLFAVRQNSYDVFSDIYLHATQLGGRIDYQDVGYANDLKPQAWQYVQSVLRSGRPDLDMVFESVSRDIKQRSNLLSSPSPSASNAAPIPRAAALVCGPSELAHQVSRFCAKFDFDFVHEEFEF